MQFILFLHCFCFHLFDCNVMLSCYISYNMHIYNIISDFRFRVDVERTIFILRSITLV